MGGPVQQFSGDAAKYHTDVTKMRSDEASGASPAELAADQAQIQKDASQLHGDIARLGIGNQAFVDQMTPQQAMQFSEAVMNLAQDMSSYANVLQNATPNRPLMPYPGAHASTMSNFQKEKGGEWLAPNPMVSVMAILRQVLHTSAMGEFVAAQGVMKGMEATEALGAQEAELDRAIGAEEFAKGVSTGMMEIAAGAVMVKTAGQNKSDLDEAYGADSAEENTATEGDIVKESDEPVAEEEAAPASKSNPEEEEIAPGLGKETIEEDTEFNVEIKGLKSTSHIDARKENIRPMGEEDPEAQANQEAEQAAVKEASNKKDADIDDQKATIKKKSDLEHTVRMNDIRTMQRQGFAQMLGGLEKITEGTFGMLIQNDQAQLAMVRTHEDINKTYTQFMSQDEGAFAEQLNGAASLLQNLSASMAQAFKWSNSSSA